MKATTALKTTFLLIVLASTAQAADQQTASQSDDTGAEKVNVESIKEKYWARGEESELGVVQNRTYSKEHKWELGVFGGVVLTDPFLNVNNLGGTFGYHFSEYFEVRGLYFKDFAGKSSALQTFESTGMGTTNYNKPHNYYGGEAVGSFLYGKLSVMGKSIIYYDMHLLGGLGATSTDNGTYATPSVGLGQQVYLGQNLSLSLDYRLMFYREELIEKVITNHLGDSLGYRNNFSNVIVLGVNFMFGGPSKKSGGQKQ